MAKRQDKKSGRFRIYESDRSGFEYGFKPVTSYPNAYTREAGKPTRDGNALVAPNEFDSPPPSKKSLGGEGDIGSGVRDNSNFSTPSDVYIVPPESTKTIIYVNSSSSIRWNTDPVVYIAGSNSTQIMSVNPQVIAGAQGQLIALECVGSNVTLLNGSGITTDFNVSSVSMSSGGVSTLFYSATDNTWHITSFSANGGF